MATAGEKRYAAWRAAGSHQTLNPVLVRIQDRLRAHGYTVYSWGDPRHMTARTPEDHTPYSATGWPSASPKGVTHALDIMPPSSGQKSKINGKPLPSLAKLSAQFIWDKDHGDADYLKYINYEPEGPNGPCYQTYWKPSKGRKSSTDRGHIHISARTDAVKVFGARTHDPVLAAQSEPVKPRPESATPRRQEREAMYVLDHEGTIWLSRNWDGSGITRVALKNMAEVEPGAKVAKAADEARLTVLAGPVYTAEKA